MSTIYDVSAKRALLEPDSSSYIYECESMCLLRVLPDDSIYAYSLQDSLELLPVASYKELEINIGTG